MHLFAKGKKILVAHESGPAFFYADYSKLDQPDHRPAPLDEPKAREVALAYLEAKGWLPSDAVVEAVRYGSLEKVEGGNRARTTFPNHTCVDLRLSLGPLNTYGPAAKIKVFLGAKNEVIGLFHAVPKLKKVDEVQLIPPRGLEKILSRRLGLSPDQIEMRNATLAVGRPYRPKRRSASDWKRKRGRPRRSGGRQRASGALRLPLSAIRAWRIG